MEALQRWLESFEGLSFWSPGLEALAVVIVGFALVVTIIYLARD